MPRALMVDGVLKSYTIPENIKSHIFQTIEMLQPGESLNDYMNERVAYIYYTYDNYDEALDAVLHFNDNIKIDSSHICDMINY